MKKGKSIFQRALSVTLALLLTFSVAAPAAAAGGTLPEPELVNLALEGTVSVSLVPDDAYMLNDGIISSREGNNLDAGPRNRWNSWPTGGTQWAAIELENKREISRVDWYALEDTAGTPAAPVAAQYWTGYEWLDLGVEAVKTTAQGEYCDSKYSTAYLYRFELETPVYTDKIRVVIYQLSGRYGAGGTELEVWGTQTGLTDLGKVSSTTLTASNEGSAQDPLSALVDGVISAREGKPNYTDPRNRWNTWPNGGEQWVAAQFEWDQLISHVNWYALEDQKGTPTVSSIKLQLLLDGEWVDSGVEAVKTRWEGPYNDNTDLVWCATAYLYTFTLPEPAMASGVRLVMTQRSDGSYGVGGTELEIWGLYQMQYGFDLSVDGVADETAKVTVDVTVSDSQRTLYAELTDSKGNTSLQTISVPASADQVSAELDLTGLIAGELTLVASWNEDMTESKTYTLTKPISDAVIQEIYDEIKTPYEYDVIVRPSGVSGDFNGSLVDNPNVFSIPGDDEYVYMTYVGHDGVGYRTGLARSKDLLTWEKVGVILDNGADGSWDSYNAAGYIVRDHVWGQIPTPHITADGLYAMTYLASDTPGYEAGIKRAGVAFTETLFDEDGTPSEWERYEDPVLDAYDRAYAYEKGTIWKLQAIYNPEDSLYYGFYNAAGGPEVMCGAISPDLIHWERMETNPLLNKDTDAAGGTWGSSHNADADVFKVGDYWVMVYFTSTPNKGIIDSFAVSTDLIHWQKSYTYLTARNSTWSSTYAHKPCMVKQNGVVYHYYCAVGSQGRVIAVDTSIDLTAMKTAQALLETELTSAQTKALTEAIEALQHELIRDGGSLAEVEAALAQLKYVMENLDSYSEADLVEELIDAIGEVTLDSKEAIDAARNAYEALTDEEKARVENYQTLLDAEKAYADLLKAQEVIELIDAIGEVTLESEEAVNTARAAYDALTEDQKVLVTNYQTLLDAEHEYVLLLAEDYALRAEEAAAAAQKAYEEAQAAYEKAMAEVAEDKTAAENAKKEAEAAKAAAEEAQKKAEEARAAAETAKAAAEENRDKAAAEALKAAEEATKAAESAQLSAEYAAKTAEALAKAQEAQAAAEAAQKEAEEAAREAEEARKAAEEAEEEAAQKRKEAEEAAEAAKEAARKAELANAKFLALYELTVLTRDIDTDELNEHELAELEKVLDELTAAIDAAETEEEVAEALAEAKAAIEAALGICPSAKFTDVVDGAWYHEGVDFMIGNGYMNGVADTAFAPNADTTRGMMVTLLYRIAGEPSVDGLTNPFEDVTEDAWYTNAVIWAVSEGIVSGRSATIFDPNAAVTRQEMVTMLWRYAGQPETEATLEGYTDAGSVGNFAATAMAWAVENGIITGVTDTELAPTGTATRAQIATVLMRYIEK